MSALVLHDREGKVIAKSWRYAGGDDLHLGPCRSCGLTVQLVRFPTATGGEVWMPVQAHVRRCARIAA